MSGRGRGPGAWTRSTQSRERGTQGRDRAIIPKSVTFRLSPCPFWILTLLVTAVACKPLAFATGTNVESGEEIPPLRPPRPELPPTFWELNAGWVLLGSALLLAICALGIWLWLKPRQRPSTPPETVARHALEPLREQPETGAVLSRVSQVVRRYFTAAFGLPPHELTTSEFRKAIAGAKDIGSELSDDVCRFLEQCDERKFAASPPATPLNAVTRAGQFIDQGEAKRQAAQAQALGEPSVTTAGARAEGP